MDACVTHQWGSKVGREGVYEDGIREGRGASRDATEIEINAYIVYTYIPLTSITAIHLSNKILFV